MIDLSGSLVVRYNTHKQVPFSRDRLFISLYESCKHRADAVSVAHELTSTVVGQLMQKIIDGSISRNTIVAITTKTLERFEPTAATIYRAFHRAESA